MINVRVLPFFEEYDVKLLRTLTDRGSEFCGNPERHEYELYLAVDHIDHSRTKTKSPQTKGVCERFHKTVLNEFCRVAFLKKVYCSLDELQADFDCWTAPVIGVLRSHSLVKGTLGVSVDEGLLLDAPHTLQVANVKRRPLTSRFDCRRDRERSA